MSQTNQQPVLLAVSAPPFWHCGRTVKKASYAMLLALAPAAFMAVWHWGIPAARVMALAMVTGIATEALCQKIITLHQGELKIDSKLGEGTVMRLYFPGEMQVVKNKSNKGAKGGR